MQDSSTKPQQSHRLQKAAENQEPLASQPALSSTATAAPRIIYIPLVFYTAL